MKRVTFTLLAVLAFTVLAPLSPFSLFIERQELPLLGNLDVCNAAAPALSANGDMPCVASSTCIAAPPFVRSADEPSRNVFAELILSSRNEQPPQS